MWWFGLKSHAKGMLWGPYLNYWQAAVLVVILMCFIAPCQRSQRSVSHESMPKWVLAAGSIDGFFTTVR